MKSDYEISKEYEPTSIKDILKKLNIKEEKIYQFGNYMAKIAEDQKGDKKGKLILVTSTSPDKAGIGKTTVTIGLNDSLNDNVNTSIACIREPALGPVFGLKGGACGGGYAQAYPMDEINLEFTGDFQAITNINNLICAAIDNEIFHGNELNIDVETICFARAIDMNERALRNIDIFSTSKKYKRKDNFKLTSASEVMAVFALAKNLEDFLNNIEDIIIAQSHDNQDITVKDLNISGSIAALAKKAINPNVVQSLKANPIFIHGGPFANIAHGTNSLIATKMALTMSDYVVTEAGFGSDMGCEKFLNLVAKKGNIDVAGVVLVTTITSLKEYSASSLLSEGVSNLKMHIRHLKKYNTNIIVTLNKYEKDTEEEIDILKQVCLEESVPFDVNNYFLEKENDQNSLLVQTIKNFEVKDDFKRIYEVEDKLEEKIKKIVIEVYNAKNYEIAQPCLEKFAKINSNTKYQNYPICFAKNPNSFSGNLDDKFKEGGYTIEITDIAVCNGAKFILLYVNKVLTLPGLGKEANMYKIKYNKDTKEIIGLS